MVLWRDIIRMGYLILREVMWLTQGHTAAVAHSINGVHLLSLRLMLILFLAYQWTWILCQADMFSVDGDLFSFLLNAEVAHLLPSPPPPNKEEPSSFEHWVLSLLESRWHLLTVEAMFFFRTLHLVWFEQRTIAPETRIQIHMNEASSVWDPAFRLCLSSLFLSLDISPNAHSPWGAGECDGVQMPSQGSLDSQKAKLTSILHLVYLMPEEWVLKSPGGARRDLPPAEVWISPS